MNPEYENPEDRRYSSDPTVDSNVKRIMSLLRQRFDRAECSADGGAKSTYTGFVFTVARDSEEFRFVVPPQCLMVDHPRRIDSIAMKCVREADFKYIFGKARYDSVVIERVSTAVSLGSDPSTEPTGPDYVYTLQWMVVELHRLNKELVSQMMAAEANRKPPMSHEMVRKEIPG